MVLRPLEPTAPGATKSLPAWNVVEASQRQTYASCWLVTQPSHAALSGELAAALSHPAFPRLDAALVKSIALHDAGWGMPDAQAIQQSRTAKNFQPSSFLEKSVSEFLEAWKGSIDTCEAISRAGGWMVSRHFYRLAAHRLSSGHDAGADKRKLESFLAEEERRQKALAAKQERSAAELEKLTDVLQFCDLFSLYLCCGALENAVFPECCGVETQLIQAADGIRLAPAVIRSGEFSLAALRYPATRQVSSREIVFSIL